MDQQFHASHLWTGEQWLSDVLIGVDSGGNIESLEANQEAGDAKRLDGPVIPALVNAHSHAFQRAMAGRAERRVGNDDFWRWRELMYALALRLSPDEQQRIATQLYIEMLKCGYTQVCEFHYLHNAPDGRPYDNIAETSEALLGAAQSVGIGMTLLPVLYQHAGFDRDDPGPDQRRFILSIDEYLQLLQRTHQALAPTDCLGTTFHSLRAVRTRTIEHILAALPTELAQSPIHIHISEQAGEVAGCRAQHGQTPVHHLMQRVALDERWALVHATHASADELQMIANAGATVVLCPGTEANLGDGLFPLPEYQRLKGTWAIGSDSQVTVNPAGELRLLEYAQRLVHQRRNVTALPNSSCGEILWSQAGLGGARAGGVQVGRLSPGWRADFLVLDHGAAQLQGLRTDEWLDGLVFSGDRTLVRDVFVAGQQRVFDAYHPGQDGALNDFAETMQVLHQL